MTREIEVKIPFGQLGISPDAARALVESHGFTVHRPRVFESNLVFDTAAGELRQSRQLLRLRRAGEHATLTYKGPAEAGGRHKSREERETSVTGFEEMRVILERLGYRVVFIYEKYRTEFTQPSSPGIVTIDETPAGNFFELEGRPEWIDATAKLLGFAEGDCLTASYSAIYLDWCRGKGIQPTNMQF